MLSRGVGERLMDLTSNIGNPEEVLRQGLQHSLTANDLYVLLTRVAPKLRFDTKIQDLVAERLKNASGSLAEFTMLMPLVPVGTESRMEIDKKVVLLSANLQQ
ncbi:MAG: hypothetical protein AAB597_03315 [Patescibacteria group bacterium]